MEHPARSSKHQRPTENSNGDRRQVKKKKISSSTNFLGSPQDNKRPQIETRRQTVMKTELFEGDTLSLNAHADAWKELENFGAPLLDPSKPFIVRLDGYRFSKFMQPLSV